MITAKHVAIAVLLLLCANNLPAKSSELANQGFDLYKKGKYAQAQVLLTKAALAEPKDVSYLYYLAMAALGNKDVPTALRALNRVMVVSATNSQYASAAAKLLARYQPGCMPYSSDMCMYSRWSKTDMPLKIYFTDGLQLPPSASSYNFTVASLLGLGEQIRSPAFYRQLQRVSTYRPEFARYARAGLDQWSWAKASGLTYTVVNDLGRANIIVVWTNKASAHLTWLLPTVPGVGVIQLMCDEAAQGPANSSQVAQVADDSDEVSEGPGNSNQAAQRPGNSAEIMLTQAAAHEFGHSFGLGHSQCKTDLMFPSLTYQVDRATNRVTCHSAMSGSDRASLKAVYDFNN